MVVAVPPEPYFRMSPKYTTPPMIVPSRGHGRNGASVLPNRRPVWGKPHLS